MAHLRSIGAFAAAALLAGLVGASPAQAQSVADFYRGKTITMLCGIGVGGEFDLLTRLVGRHIVHHIPGNPSSVAQNIVGATGMKMLNYLYEQAPRDGTYIGMVQTALPAAQTMGLPGIQFDAAKLHWLGTMAPSTEVLGVMSRTGVKSIEDARRREVVIGASSRGGCEPVLHARERTCKRRTIRNVTTAPRERLPPCWPV